MCMHERHIHLTSFFLYFLLLFECVHEGVFLLSSFSLSGVVHNMHSFHFFLFDTFFGFTESRITLLDPNAPHTA